MDDDEKVDIYLKDQGKLPSVRLYYTKNKWLKIYSQQLRNHKQKKKRETRES